MATISNMQRILIACVLIISGCASNTQLVPVASPCPPFPIPPKELMQSPPTAYLLQQTPQKQP